MISKFSFVISILVIILLSGCSQKIIRDNVSDVAASGASAACTLVNPIVGFVCGAATGVIVNDALPPADGPDLSEIPEAQRAEVLKNQQMWAMVESLGVWIIAVIGGFFMLPLLLGYLMPNKRQRKLEKLAFNNPDIKSTDLE